ncbi:hypothetical protein CMV_001562 [Castanea mollissima]|uniref:Uncharacterized protein n=1 Tax=Castanea mollissima TaxID=60419 RepID=A0A8J4VWU5_9ROSI|nr:hypothetical protein CMV_001562 [Castanea mollissima]
MDYKRNPWPMMLSFLFICLSLNNHPSLGADTISANQPLSGDQTISSNGGNFELGFFTQGNSSRSNYYIGMWYKKVSLRTIVWVANRETPVSDRSSSVLRISDGNLVLFNESQIPIWSTNLSSTSSGPLEAVLRDDGNFVLRDGSANSSKLLWQSFDNPTHTWLPGGKIAYNNKTKQNMHLISWKNSEDPAPGLFALELQQNTSSYIIRWNKTVPYWNSGPWDGKIFSWVPEMRANYIYNFSYVSNENESYFTYSLYDPSIISRFVMDISGQIQQLSWLESTKQWNLFWSQPRTQCEVYAFCGPFGICNQQSLPFCSCLKGFQATSSNNWNLSDFSAGCARKTSLQCGNDSLANGKRDKFWEMPNMKLPDHPQTVAVGSSSECESACLNNCSCTAYAYGANCSIWIGDLLNLKQLTSSDTTGGTLYLKLAASELPSSRNNKAIIIGVAITAKADVYSYGMMLFEFVSGRRNSEPSADGKIRFFPTWAASLITQGGDVLSLLDPRLEGNADEEEVTRICRLACWCIQDDETHRPPMGQVVQILEGVLDVNLAPVPRSLQVFVDDQEHIIFFTESSSSQSSQARSNNSNASSHSKISMSSTSSKS